jgi:hypothetical protein
MAQLQAFKLGHATILVDDDEFGDGYSNGLLAYSDQEKPLTVEALRKIIVESMTDSEQTENWNIGYITGAIRGIHEGAYTQKEDTDAPYVQLGSLTLHLNRWRFRDGFYNGMREYEIKQDERKPAGILTARELLSYLAHRDPKTNRYYFGQDELSALEDILGRFVGYFCAALSLQPEYPSEPVESAVRA